MTKRRGHKLSAATRKKISARLKGKHHKGHKMSAAARAKLSKELKGRHYKRTSKAKTTTARKPTAKRVVAGARRHSGRTPRHPAYGKGATRFHKARRQLQRASRHHARRQLLRATRHQARHQRSRNYKVHKPRQSRRR